MQQVERFGVSMPASLLESFDAAIEQAGYPNRSEAIRDIVRDYLVRQQWNQPETEVVGTITLVYDHHSHEIEERLTELQHEHCSEIICSTHVHLDRHHCMEVIVLRGSSTRVREIAQQLLTTQGVKHGGLTATTSGECL